MDSATRRSRLQGCYVTIPTMFRDADLEVDLDAIRRHVRFLIDGGLTTGDAVLLAGGAAGDFSTLTFDERLSVAEAVVDEAPTMAAAPLRAARFGAKLSDPTWVRVASEHTYAGYYGLARRA